MKTIESIKGIVAKAATKVKAFFRSKASINAEREQNELCMFVDMLHAVTGTIKKVQTDRTMLSCVPSPTDKKRMLASIHKGTCAMLHRLSQLTMCHASITGTNYAYVVAAEDNDLDNCLVVADRACISLDKLICIDGYPALYSSRFDEYMRVLAEVEAAILVKICNNAV